MFSKLFVNALKHIKNIINNKIEFTDGYLQNGKFEY